MSTATVDLATLLPPPYTAYSYSYPHKSYYRPLQPPVPLAEAWRAEPKDALFLYLHIPFCEMRCGFCNLFALSQPAHQMIDGYLAQLQRQAAIIRQALGPARFARFAIGGGTPTLLSPAQLERLFDLGETFANAPLASIPGSVETSPATATTDRLQVLARRGVSRISIGVQSFSQEETGQMGRPQRPADVYAALDRIRELGFPCLNIDLIYGGCGQTQNSWLFSVREAALRYRAEEIFLYPLYVRPQTGLAKRKHMGATGSAGVEAQQDAPSDPRLALYRAARDLLLAEGYEQISMRCFRLKSAAIDEGAAYCCQQDGMIGLGCGARSYTAALHYSTRFATHQAGVRDILHTWLDRSATDFSLATHGVWLNEEERRRRFIILSLLQAPGLDTAAYGARFGGDPVAEFPLLAALIEAGLARLTGQQLQLTPAGLEQSDAIGPALYSAPARAALEAFIGD